MRSFQATSPPAEWRTLSGILLLDKPQALSSNQALQRVRRLYRARKAGHTGSLDPLATGLLPICFGEATKIAGLLLGSRKAYTTECRLGIATTTDDAEGEIIEQRNVPQLADADIRIELTALEGRILQVAPVYSALKQAGVPLYKRARRGEQVIAPARAVNVYRFELLERRADGLRLLIECGSGTYVRSLVRDLGQRLGCGAHVTELRRLWVEPFRTPVMHRLDELTALTQTNAAAADALLLPLERGLVAYPQLRVDGADALRLRQGRSIAVGDRPRGHCVVLDAAGRAVALAESDGEGRLRCVRGFNAAC